MTIHDHVISYTSEAQRLISHDFIKVTDLIGRDIPYTATLGKIINMLDTADPNLMAYLIGNGGSAGIASENANRLNKYCGIKTMTFNDPISMSASANDSLLGWPGVFAEILKRYIKEDDLLIAISSSGSSENIINAVDMARQAKAVVITLYGFKSENPLRKLGDFNFYIPSSDYQLVEGSHSHILGLLVNTFVLVRQQKINPKGLA